MVTQTHRLKKVPAGASAEASSAPTPYGRKFVTH